MKMTNVSGQQLTFPDGAHVNIGDTRDLTDADKGNAAVKEWIDAGWLTEANTGKPALKALKD